MSLHIGVHRINADPTWRTPAAVYRDLDREFGFTLDPCPSGPILVDGLTSEWSGRVFVNPPYGRAIADWMRKIITEAPRCEVIVALVPCRTDTAWWHDYAMKAEEIRFVRGRLSFEGVHAPKGHNAPFPSVILVFRRVGPCIFDGCVSTDRHWHGGFPGGYDNPDDPEGPPIEFTTTPVPGVRDYNGALLREEA